MNAKLSIRDYADLELLHVIDDHSGESSKSLGALLEVEPRAVGMRLSWMKRYGLVDRNTEGGWVVGRRGRAILNGRADALLDIRNAAKRAARDSVTSWVARREWARNFA